MKFLNNLIKKPNVFQRTVGLSLELFKKLSLKLEQPWLNAEKIRKNKKQRIRKAGGGRPYQLMSIELKLAVVLIYYKAYITQELLGLLIGLDQANVSRLLKKMLHVIELAADPELSTFVHKAKQAYNELNAHEKVGDLTNFFAKYPDLKTVANDATEQQCFRSQDNDTQKQYYSGKKKLHTLKTQISVSSSGRILDVTKTYPGSIHDKNLIDQEKTIQKFPERTCQRLDLGYQGVCADNPDHYLVIPIKKPHKKELSPFAKELNTLHSKRRIIVENVLSRVKKFKICKYTYRGPIASYNQVFRNIAALVNYRLNVAIV